MPALTVDGTAYNVCVSDLKRKASILDGSNAGRVITGAMQLDTIGTFYNYSYTFFRGSSISDYDALYEVLTSATNRVHTVIVPYGQGTITFTAYVSGVSDDLVSVTSSANYWDGMTADFIGMRPYKTP